MDSSRKERRSNRQQLFLEQQQKDYDHEDRMPKQVYTQLIIGLDKEQCTTPSRRKTVHLDNSSVASGSTGNTSYPIGTPPRSAGANGGRSSRTVASDNARHRSQRSRSFTREDERKMSSSSRSDYSSRNRSERVISADVPRSRRRSRSPSGRSDIVVSQSTGMYSAQTTKRGGQQHAQSAKITTPSPSNFNNNNNRHNYGGGGASDQISAGSFGANFSSFDFRDTPPSVYKDKTESLASTVNRSSFRSGSDRDESTKELLKLHAKMSRKVVDGKFYVICLFPPPMFFYASNRTICYFRVEYAFVGVFQTINKLQIISINSTLLTLLFNFLLLNWCICRVKSSSRINGTQNTFRHKCLCCF